MAEDDQEQEEMEEEGHWLVISSDEDEDEDGNAFRGSSDDTRSVASAASTELSQHSSAYWADRYTGLISLASKNIPPEIMILLGYFLGLDRADQYWVLPSGHQFLELEDGGLSGMWTINGWLISYAPAGSELVVGGGYYRVIAEGMGIEPRASEGDESSEDESSD